ncbi:hypothetical protein [Pseudomonas sp. ACM7]|uniref:hypothetical protein n=1 Tax=Pseudomonas sp. ACM7 TaxID=2052956 RepID=UPI002114F130|nr:hypothetical protein [Pseudomonas sp. ACM7]
MPLIVPEPAISGDKPMGYRKASKHCDQVDRTVSLPGAAPAQGLKLLAIHFDFRGMPNAAKAGSDAAG